MIITKSKCFFRALIILSLIVLFCCFGVSVSFAADGNVADNNTVGEDSITVDDIEDDIIGENDTENDDLSIEINEDNTTVSGLESEYDYTGEPIMPEVEVIVDETSLVISEDFEVRYENNVDPGEGSIIISGIGKYSGTVVKTFIIKQEVKTGWYSEGGVWYYYDNGVMQYDKWINDGNGWCWLESDGRMAVNRWVVTYGAWYYVGQDGYMLTNRWVNDGIGWCWVDSGGMMLSNRWISWGNQWYFLKANGYMAVDQWVYSNKSWFWVGPSGVMASNSWLCYNNNWYYLKGGGYMAANQWLYISNAWYWFDSSGRMANNEWLRYNGAWYFLKSGGYMAYNQWLYISNHWYKFDANGAMESNKWILSNGYWYYLKKDGSMAANEWVHDSNGWRWLDGSGKLVKDEGVFYKGVWYYLKDDGYMETAPYIFINISEQMLYYYKNGKLVLDTPIVSGKLYPDHRTPTGNFRVIRKATDQTLRGFEDDGEPYESYVYYWMAFIGGEYGIHDATWRYSSEFGGTTYKYYGSHGCVNIPYSAAETLYSNVSVGTRVRIQW